MPWQHSGIMPMKKAAAGKAAAAKKSSVRLCNGKPGAAVRNAGVQRGGLSR